MGEGLFGMVSCSLLVKYFGDRGMLVEALALLLSTHVKFGAVPEEKYVKRLRLECRRQQITSFGGEAIASNVVMMVRGKRREEEHDEVPRAIKPSVQPAPQCCADVPDVRIAGGARRVAEPWADDSVAPVHRVGADAAMTS